MFLRAWATCLETGGGIPGMREREQLPSGVSTSAAGGPRSGISGTSWRSDLRAAVLSEHSPLIIPG